jgi:membrane protease YdiL (CAAX protease family)
MMTDAIAKPTFWQRFWAFRYARLIILFVMSVVFVFISNLLSVAAARLMRLATEGIPLTAKSVPGRALNPVSGIVVTIVVILSLVLVMWAYSRLSQWLERRRVGEFERHRIWQRLAAGALIGTGAILLSVAIIAALGDATIAVGHRFAFSSATIIPVLVAPVIEELLFRGILFRIVEEMYGTLVALIVSGLFFGFAHLSNPNSSVLAASCIAVEAGLLLGMAYVATRSLWLPIGLHFGWNFTEGDLLGCPDSGNIVHGIFETTTRGDPLITGGGFGPEASLITPALCLVATYFLYRLAAQRGTWQPLRMAHFAPINA